jgi:protein-disulfide isomerase
MHMKEKIVKKPVLFISVLIFALLSQACTKPDYKKVANDFITASTPLRDYDVRDVMDTSSPDWKAVVVYVKQNGANMPVLLLISQDGKSVVANAMVYVDNKPVFTQRLEPELGRVDFKPADRDRIVFNPAGTTTVFMFTDPDCPYCKVAREKIQNYKGEYRILIKHFPLEQIHPEAKGKAIEEQAEWLKNTRPDLKGADIRKEAERIVAEDISEAHKAGITGVPSYVMEDGSLKQGLF